MILVMITYPKYLFTGWLSGYSNLTVFYVYDPAISCEHPQPIVTNVFSDLVEDAIYVDTRGCCRPIWHISSLTRVPAKLNGFSENNAVCESLANYP